MPPINNYVVETILLPPERRNDEIAARALKLLNRTLGAAEAHMEGREFIAGDFTVADTITGHAVIMSRRLGADFSSCPNLSAYADRLEAREAFKTPRTRPDEPKIVLGDAFPCDCWLDLTRTAPEYGSSRARGRIG